MHLIQFSEDIVKGFIHGLRSAKFYVIHCLRKMRIYSKASFQFTDVVLLIHKVLMRYNDCIFFTIYGDGYWVAAGQGRNLIIVIPQFFRRTN